MAQALSNSANGDSSVDAFFYGSIKDNSSLRSQILDVVSTFSCVSFFNEMKNFFSNPKNISGIQDAFDKYGMPTKNRQAVHHTFGGWKDYCDWTNIGKFYEYARLSIDFPSLNPSDMDNCYGIKNYIVSLQDAKAAADKLQVSKPDEALHTSTLQAINDKIDYYNSLNSKMNCSVYIQKQDDIRAAELEANTIALTQQSNLETFAATTKTSADTSKIAVYVFAGVAVLIGILVAKKVLTK